MNDEAARQGRPVNSNLSPPIISREVARLRAGIWAATEALEAGDTWGACDALLALIESLEAA